MTDRLIIYIGKIIHCTGTFRLEEYQRGFIIVENEKIKAIGDYSDLRETKERLGISNTCFELVELTQCQILIPGLIDTHIHAPQYPNMGLGYDKQLLDWLESYTFPLEKKYENIEYAKKVYKNVVRDTLSFGTTTASYFGTIHLESTIELANACLVAGQRAFIGKVNMTEPESPEGLKEDPDESIQKTETFIKALNERESDLVKPIVTPRFALSCDHDVMTKLGDLAKKYNVNIQSHISENEKEVELVTNRFSKSYANVYADCHLLTQRSVMAHGIYLTKDEQTLLAHKGTSVAHCPTSNFFLRSGNCNVPELIENGVNVSLGTDVAGGHSLSMIEVMRQAILNSISLSFNNPDVKPLTCTEVFYMATLGGAKALAIDKKVGNFVVKKQFDALIVDLGVYPSRIQLKDDYSMKNLLQKFIYTADDRNIKNVYVAGRSVKCCENQK